MEKLKEILHWVKINTKSKRSKVLVTIIVTLLSILFLWGCGTLHVKGTQDYEYNRGVLIKKFENGIQDNY